MKVELWAAMVLLLVPIVLLLSLPRKPCYSLLMIGKSQILGIIENLLRGRMGSCTLSPIIILTRREGSVWPLLQPRQTRIQGVR
jgi:hypothetical protein